MSNNIPYERSFASHPKAIYWSDKNGDIKPRDISEGSNKNIGLTVIFVLILLK